MYPLYTLIHLNNAFYINKKKRHTRGLFNINNLFEWLKNIYIKIALFKQCAMYREALVNVNHPVVSNTFFYILVRITAVLIAATGLSINITQRKHKGKIIVQYFFNANRKTSSTTTSLHSPNSPQR